MAKSVAQEFTKGLWAEVPPFRLVLGLCPTLAVTKSLGDGFGMGLATTFVLLCSNMLISMLKNVIPKQVRLSCFIIVIATFVTIVQLLMQAFTYPLYQTLGIFIPLIVVNCIVLGRAEAFAAKNPVIPSMADGLGMGIGFTLSLTVLAAFRELFGKGTLTLPFEMGTLHVMGASYKPFTFLIEAPGAFICLGLMLCVMNMLGKK
ncbi:MAG: electron transport complex subunit E [Deltaproteobacteria bacterium]|nr:electron transport complex subunit E [Deltaproteobacteria bacterium]